MSRLHTVRASVGDIAGHFRAKAPGELVIPPQTTEGNPGVVVIEREGRLVLRNMIWGFPRPQPKEGSNRIGLVADLTNPMWSSFVVDPRFRCLIVLTHFANPDGHSGSKTRTWFSVEDQPILAWAGFCRNSEAGPVYAGMTMEANAAIPPTNDRMPVLIEPKDYHRWLHGSVEDVIWFPVRQAYRCGPDDR